MAPWVVAAYRRRVVFASLRGRWPFGPRVVDCPFGNSYKVSVTGLAFVIIAVPVISSGGTCRFESLLHGASETEPRNLPVECCLSAVTPV